MATPSWQPGMFVWRDLVADDVDRARRFHGELFGWSWKGQDMGPSGTYWLASSGGQQIGGLMAKPAPMPSLWSSYVLVDDVDAAASRCRGAGGAVVREPADIPGVGRFAVLADPWGAVLHPFRPLPREPSPRPTPRPGLFCWETLVTPDPAKAIAFHRAVLGFGTAPTPNGEGTMFTAGQEPVADVQPARAGGRGSWTTYVAVEDAEATRDRAVRLGGKILIPRIDIEKVGTIALIADAEGAALGLFQGG
jgi:uncharacterized protein